MDEMDAPREDRPANAPPANAPPSSSTSPGRPTDDDVVPIDVQLAWQEQYCKAAGAPTAALILQAVREDFDSHGVCAGLLPERTRFGDLIGLRIMAAIHLLAIERQAPAVALHAPTLGGVAPAASANPAREAIRFRAAVIEAIRQHPDRVRLTLDQVPQTNEVGRSIPLRIALSQIALSQIAGSQIAGSQIAGSQVAGSQVAGSQVANGRPESSQLPRGTRTASEPSPAATDRPLAVRLLEIGASAGLNLRADHLPGRPDLEAGPMPVIAERLGCDLNPIDPTSTAGRARLTSYMWLDDVDRFERLREALDVASRVPATVVQQDAVAFAQSMDLRPGVTTLLWHSAMWIYLSPSARAQIEQEIMRLGRQASPRQPFWHVCWEWASDPGPESTKVSSDATFSLTARCWSGLPDDGAPHVLATGTSHGRTVRLTTDAR